MNNINKTSEHGSHAGSRLGLNSITRALSLAALLFAAAQPGRADDEGWSYASQTDSNVTVGYVVDPNSGDVVTSVTHITFSDEEAAEDMKHYSEPGLVSEDLGPLDWFSGCYGFWSTPLEEAGEMIVEEGIDWLYDCWWD